MNPPLSRAFPGRMLNTSSVNTALCFFDLPLHSLFILHKKSPRNTGDFAYAVRVSKKDYFLLISDPTGEDPEINTDKIDLIRRKRLNVGL